MVEGTPLEEACTTWPSVWEKKLVCLENVLQRVEPDGVGHRPQDPLHYTRHIALHRSLAPHLSPVSCLTPNRESYGSSNSVFLLTSRNITDSAMAGYFCRPMC